MNPMKMTARAAMRLALLAGACGLGLAAPAAAAQAPTTPPPAARSGAYVPAASNLAARQWFQDAKFGAFVHWGLYSQLGGVGTPTGAEWIMQNSRIPVKNYERLASFFNPSDFDADAWMKAFKSSGARYLVITTKHHDGFAMWKSAASPFNVVDATPFGRDVIKEVAEAARRHDIKLFFYFSQLDWRHPDYYPTGRTGQFAGRPAGGDWERYLDYQDAQIRELMTNYGEIGGVWFDGWWDQEDTALRDRWRLERTYKMIHDLQPQALIVNNHHQTPFDGEDYQTFERDLPGQNTMGYSPNVKPSDLPLEMAETMNGSWGYSLLDNRYKSVDTLVKTLVGAAGRNANLLLNTGPMPNGQIQPENLETYKKIGAWLKDYGVSIYGARGGPVSPRPWGVTTQKGKTVYVHILDNPDQRLFVPLTAAIKSARTLVGGQPIRVERTEGGVFLTGAAKPAGVVDHVIVLDLN